MRQHHVPAEAGCLRVVACFLDPAAVDAVHALIIDQCQILGDYPYVLARADEIAVVGRRDQENLNLMIDNVMLRHGITALATAKQGSKDIARAGRTRHEL